MKPSGRCRIIGLFVATAVAAGLFAAMMAFAATPSKSLEGLLKESGLDYVRTPEGAYKILVSVEGEATLVVALERALGESEDLKLVYLYCSVVEVPKGFKHPPAMLKKMAEVNDRLIVGKLGMSGDTGDVFYNSSFWLRTADSKILVMELALAHQLRAQLRKELLPFLTQ
jgi:hypothetical protein